MLLPPLPHFQPFVPCFTLPSPSVASSSYSKEDCRQPPLFLLSSSVTGQPSAVHYPCRRCHPSAVDILHSLAAAVHSRLCHNHLLAALSLHPLCPLLSVVPSFPCISTTTAANCRIQRCPTSSLKLQPSPATNHCPSPISSSASSIYITVSPHCCHLSPIVAASSLATAALATTAIFQLRPFHYTSLLPPLQLLVTGCCLLLPLQTPQVSFTSDSQPQQQSSHFLYRQLM
ncbi:hypothetical protein GW17_00020242 [Ensete ventricosum]|nr:hypothetical protein GW17_00020242 [Ensete ventricosum]RZR99959.1 hypothetical protein BHM03_00029587 [Ensete ventricosum]